MDSLEKLENEKLLNYIHYLEQENCLLKKQKAEIERLAFHDKLTGLLNRYALNYEQSCFSTIMIDIDSFKFINDRYGHIIGDRVLELIGKMLLDLRTEDDKIIRYGGEEFLIIIQNENPDYTINMIKSIQNKMKELSVNVEVTLSFGYCINDNYSLDECILRADDALLYSKNNGKNQYTSYDDLKLKLKR